MPFSPKNFIEDESGATVIEYSLLAGVLVVAVVAGARAIGTTLSLTFPKISGNLA